MTEREQIRESIRDADALYSAEEMTSCVNKLSHLTQEAAMLTARKAERVTREAFDVYHCKFCGGWHIGHH